MSDILTDAELPTWTDAEVDSLLRDLDTGRLSRIASGDMRFAAKIIRSDRKEIARLRAELDEALTMVVLCGNCGNRYKCKRTDLNATCPCQGKVSEPDACHEDGK